MAAVRPSPWIGDLFKEQRAVIGSQARFKSVTSLAAFDVFLTCEQSQTTTVAAPPELLPVHYAAR